VTERDQGPPAEVVQENARAKAQAVAAGAGSGRVVLGVDTVVSLGRRLYGKPVDEPQAREFLTELSDHTHQVWSAIALLECGSERVETAVTDVCFRSLDEATLDWYLASAEWRERAGAYAIQGRGAALVERIEGDYWNVVGLPLALLLTMMPALMQGKEELRNL